MIHKFIIFYGISVLIAPIPTLYTTCKCVSKASKYTYKTIVHIKTNYL